MVFLASIVFFSLFASEATVILGGLAGTAKHDIFSDVFDDVCSLLGSLKYLPPERLPLASFTDGNSLSEILVAYENIQELRLVSKS